MVTITSPKTALARLTSDSIASDSSPTESVTNHASVLSAMVTSATPTDAHSIPRGDSRRWRKGVDMA